MGRTGATVGWTGSKPDDSIGWAGVPAEGVAAAIADDADAEEIAVVVTVANCVCRRFISSG